MTKKDYIAIAEIIKTKLDQDEITETSLIFKFIQSMADYFEQDNPRFNRGKFIHACHNNLKKEVA